MHLNLKREGSGLKLKVLAYFLGLRVAWSGRRWFHRIYLLLGSDDSGALELEMACFDLNETDMDTGDHTVPSCVDTLDASIVNRYRNLIKNNPFETRDSSYKHP